MTPPDPAESLPSLSMVFPAYNEEAGIERTLAEATACGEGNCHGGMLSWFEVVIVDDGSTDGTAGILERAAARDERIRVVSHTYNRGLGAAVRSGLEAATADLVFYTDADLPIDLAEVGTAIDLLEQQEVDVVSAYRRRRYPEGPRRFLYSLTYNALIRLALGVKVRDVNFAAKLIRRQVIDDITLKSDGSFIDAELMARASRRHFRIAQFPADYRPREHGVSALSSPPVIRRILSEMSVLGPQIRRERPGSAGR